MTIDLIQSLFLKEFANIRILSQIFNSDFKIIFNVRKNTKKPSWRGTIRWLADYTDKSNV